MRALLRRVYGELLSESSVYRVGELELNVETHLVSVAGQRIDLTLSEFAF